MPFSGLGLLALTLAAWLAAPTAAEGPYTRRQANRGEQTSTSAKLGTFAFIDDAEATPQRLAFFVDAGPCRDPLLPDLIPLRIGVAYRGDGEPLRLSPDRFRLNWQGATSPLSALSQHQLLALPRGRAAIGHGQRSVSLRHAPLPFDSKDGLRVPTAFQVDPSVGVSLNDETELPAAAWFSDLVFFQLPSELELWGELLRLSFVGEADEELVGVTFRVEEDSQLNRKAFRRAKKARQAEEREARERARRAAESQAMVAPSAR